MTEDERDARLTMLLRAAAYQMRQRPGDTEQDIAALARWHVDLERVLRTAGSSL